MLKLIPPHFSVEDILDELLSDMTKTKEVKDEYGNLSQKKYIDLFSAEIKNRIFVFEKSYIDLAKEGKLHKLKPEDCMVSDEIGKEEMEFLYEQKLVTKYRDSYYLRLRTNENNNFSQCVYCERDLVTDLDHLLPQSKFPIFAVTPANLIPSCHTCNKNKSASLVDIVNPYYEDTTKENWLKCTIILKNNILLPEYSLDFSSTSYSNSLQTKISNIYTMGRTSILMRINTWGVNKFTNKLDLWKKIIDIGGKEQLITLLNSEIASDRTHSQNFYEISLYQGVIDYLNIDGQQLI